MLRPKLRKLDRFPLTRDGEPYLVLQDPHRLDDPLAVDPLLADYLDMMDGQKSVAQIRQSFLMRGKNALPLDELQAVVDTLAECGFLDDENFRARWGQALREFQAAPSLNPELAGLAYPDDPQRLRQEFRALLSDPPCPQSKTRALVWPYGPYPFTADNPLAHESLAALPCPKALDGVLLLVTSHHDGKTPYQLIDKTHHTALGPVPAIPSVVQALVHPRPWLSGEPMRWRGEQSLEVPLLALRARYGDACPPVLPLLCGRACFSQSEDEEQVLQSASLLAEIENLLATGRWLLVASAQLGHASGEGSEPEASTLDQTLVRALEQKQERAFFPSVLRKVPSQQRPVGAPVLATMLSILPPAWRCTSAQRTRRRTLDGAGSIGHAYLRYEAVAGRP